MLPSAPTRSRDPTNALPVAGVARRVPTLRCGMLRWARFLPVQCLIVAVLFWAYHLWLAWLMRHAGLRLGAVSHKLAPLYAYFDPRLKGGLAVALAALGGYGFFVKRAVLAGRVRPLGLMAAVMAWMAVLAVAVASIDGGLHRLARPFQRSDVEYYGAVARVGNVREFIGSYAMRALELPMHAQTHPPGAVLLLWVIERLFGKGPQKAAWAVILFSTLSVPAVYLLARDVAGDATARLAAGLYVLMPNVLLFTATSMDGPFAVALVWSIFLGWKAVGQGSLRWGFGAGLVLAIASFMTFSASVVGLFLMVAAIVRMACSRQPSSGAGGLAACDAEAMSGNPVLVPVLPQPRHSWHTCCRALAGIALGGLAFYVPLYAATGYDPAEMLGTAMSISADLMGSTGHASWWQHGHIAAANVVVFLFSCGLAVSILGMREITAWCRRRSAQTSHLRIFAVASLITLAVTTALPLYSLETERIWIFLAPLIAIPAAVRLARTRDRREAQRAFLIVALLLSLQTVLTELLLNTYW